MRRAVLFSPAAAIIAVTMCSLSAQERQEAPAAAKPISFSVDYTLASDYIWRGINLSEYSGEGPEKLNHQLGTNVSVETPIGSFGGGVWFEWYMGQEHLIEEAHNKLQEVDYTLCWSYCFEEIGTELEAGWVSYTFPHVTGDVAATYEFYGKVSFEDRVLFGVPLINPFVYWGIDPDLAKGGSWIQVGGSHDFALSDLPGIGDLPVVRSLTLTPSISLAVDLRYLHNFAVAASGRPSKRVANVIYGIAADLDLSEVLGLPKKYGGVSTGAFLNFSQAVRRDILRDELYGGVTVSYSW